MLINYGLVIAGLIVLLFGGDLLVRGAVSMARRLNISPLVIGFTVVAFGTSMPELVVCIDAALHGAPAIAVGNVVGSNIANIFLVLGLPALIYPILYEPDDMRRDVFVMIGGTVVFIAFMALGTIVLWHGVVLFSCLALVLFDSYRRARAKGPAVDCEDFTEGYEGIEGMPRRLSISLLFVFGGSVGLVLGAEWLIEGAVGLALAFGVSEAVIGLTVVALGTSLPELVTSLVAAFRREGEVAIGNVLGSNLFNVLGIMGLTAMVSPLPVPPKIMDFDIWVMLGAALVLAVVVLSRLKISRAVGLVFCIAYAAFVTAQFQGMSGMPAAAG